MNGHGRRPHFSIIPFLFTFCTTSLHVEGSEIDRLSQGFLKPPDAAKPRAYWWWLDSNTSEAGITRDLEEMKRLGIGGVLIFDAGLGNGAPVGPPFMGPEWRERVNFAVQEADRLGIEVGLNLCSGWDCGGTWVEPKHACQKLVWSQTHVQDPLELSRVLPAPQSVDSYYRDIAVVAFRKNNSMSAGSLPLDM